MSIIASKASKQTAIGSHYTSGIPGQGTSTLPSLSLLYDQEKDRYRTIDNWTGKTSKVTSLGQAPLEYDLQISGVAPTKMRNVLAKQKPGLQYALPESLKFQPDQSYYAKPQRKFVGYVQFPRPKLNLDNSQPTISAKSSLETNQRGFFPQPGSRAKTIARDDGTPAEAKMLRFGRKEFGGTRSETALASAKDDTMLFTGRTRELSSTQRNLEMAKAIQDQFNKTYSKRLQKVPSFLSTHMSSFASQYHLGEVSWC